VAVLGEFVLASRGGDPRRSRRQVLGRDEWSRSQRYAWLRICRRVGGRLARYSYV
jgi:hypothetical protein